MIVQVLFRIICVYVAVCSLSLTGCESEEGANNKEAQKTQKEERQNEENDPARSRLVLRYYKMEGHYTDVDAHGNPKYYKYHGRRVKIVGHLSDIRLVKHSPSISVENSVAIFQLDSGTLVPGHPKVNTVELWFDERAVEVEGLQFRTGDTWEITLTDHANLVALRPQSQTKNHQRDKGNKGDK